MAVKTETACMLYRETYKANGIFPTSYPRVKVFHGTHSAIIDISKMATLVIGRGLLF